MKMVLCCKLNEEYVTEVCKKQQRSGYSYVNKLKTTDIKDNEVVLHAHGT